MSRKSHAILVTSITAAMLGLSQGALATETAATPPAPPAPPAMPAPISAPESPDAIIARMEARHKQMAEERERRYEELREHASQLGFEMPEMPPWEPSERTGMPSPDYAPWITAEERDALREKRWQETRARAAEHGVELPEMPPWKAAEERRKAMKARIEKFRETMDALSKEQREAIESVIGEMPEIGELPDFGEMPDFGEAPSFPGRGMGRGWGHPSRCPHPGKPCQHRYPGYAGPMAAPPGMIPQPATQTEADAGSGQAPAATQ